MYCVFVTWSVGRGKKLKKKFESPEKYEPSKQFAYWAHRMLAIYDDNFNWTMGA